MIKLILLDDPGGIHLSSPFLLYGSYGYTASLIAEIAVRRGIKPLLAGRDLDRLKVQADALGLEYRHISLDDAGALDVALREVSLVLNCAGPFSHTFLPVVKACLRTGRHYLDITGEVVVFEALAALDQNAREAGVMLLPGIGLDVVPSDCLAAYLKQRLPDATQLTLALRMSGGSSRGTLLTGIEGISSLGMVRKDGKLVRAKPLLKVWQIDFGRGPRPVLRFPWGDISTAFYSTGIPSIETYMAFPRSWLRLMQALRPLLVLANSRFVQTSLRRAVMRMPPGPSEEARNRGEVNLWGEVKNDQGKIARFLLKAPGGHNLTAETSLAAVTRVLAGDLKPGFQTPSLAYGADFILEFEGVTRQDLQGLTT